MTREIPSMVIQPFVENAIKHNSFTQEQPLFLEISGSGKQLVIRNRLQPKFVIEHSTQTGLSNLKERYRLLTGKEMRVTADVEWFVVAFETLKHEDSDH